MPVPLTAKAKPQTANRVSWPRVLLTTPFRESPGPRGLKAHSLGLPSKNAELPMAIVQSPRSSVFHPGKGLARSLRTSRRNKDRIGKPRPFHIVHFPTTKPKVFPLSYVASPPRDDVRCRNELRERSSCRVFSSSGSTRVGRSRWFGCEQHSVIGWGFGGLIYAAPSKLVYGRVHSTLHF